MHDDPKAAGDCDIGPPAVVYTGGFGDYYNIDQPWELNNSDYMRRVLWFMRDALVPECRRLVGAQGLTPPTGGSRNVAPENANAYQVLQHLKQNIDRYATALGQDTDVLQTLASRALKMLGRVTYAVPDKDGFTREEVLTALNAASILAAAARVRHVQRNIHTLEEQFKAHSASKERRNRPCFY
jgi:hypothetical protein